jgi:hypothetical protein
MKKPAEIIGGLFRITNPKWRETRIASRVPVCA